MIASAIDLRERVAAQVTNALRECGLARDEAQLNARLRRVDGEGARLFEEELVLNGTAADARDRAAACFALGISISTIHRVTGFGAWQARVLGGRSAERAGAMFNLGIVLFDAMLDRGNEGARSDALRFRLEGESVAGGGPELAFFRCVAGRFFELAGAAADRTMLEAMLSAERSCADRSIQGQALLRSMRLKSVGPFLMLARLGSGSVEQARAFGRAVWIVDDLWDWEEDETSGTPGRPALRIGSRDDIVAAEVRRLSAALASSRDWPSEARACLAATLGAWVRMPRPQPLFAETSDAAN